MTSSGMGLSTRVGLAAGIAVALAVVLTSTAVYLATARTLRSELDQDLAQIVDEVMEGSTQLRPGARRDPFGGAGGLVQALDDGGGVLQRNDAPELPVSDGAARVADGRDDGRRFESATILDAGVRIPLRIVTIPVRGQVLFGPSGNGVALGAVQVAVPASQQVATLTRLRSQLLLGGLVGTALAALVGWSLGHRATRPVLELTNVAEGVRATGDLTRRITVQGDDELARLATTFNGMLAAIERIQESQTRLVVDASHELRTPLTSLRTNIDVLADYERLARVDRADLLRDVSTQIDEFGTLVDSLVALTRDARADVVMQPLELDDLVVEVVDSARRFVPVDRPIEVTTTPVAMTGDHDTLARAVRCLLDNAVKYGAGAIDVAVGPDGPNAVVTVGDHGPGVAGEDAERIFDRFHRAAETRDVPGSGLGLAIVAQAAAVHGGRAWVDDTPGGGATFHLAVPTG